MCSRFIVWLIAVTIVIAVFFVRKRVYYIFSSCPSSTSRWILMCLIVSFLLTSPLNNSLLSFNCTSSIQICLTCQCGQSHDDYSGMESNTSGHFRFFRFETMACFTRARLLCLFYVIFKIYQTVLWNLTLSANNVPWFEQNCIAKYTISAKNMANKW